MNANAGWIIPFIILGGALQSCGAAMNGQLNKHVVNPWLASAISFALITFFFAGASLIHPHPLPAQKDLAELPWWAVVGRFGRGSSGLRWPHASEQGGSGAVRRLYRYGRAHHVLTHRPFRLVQNAASSSQPRPYHWRFAAGRRNQLDCEVLKAN